MIENLWVAAQISLLGMSLVFGAILLLWGTLALLVRLTDQRPATESPATEMAASTAIPAGPAEAGSRKDTLARAAAAAVAVALALKANPSMPSSASTSAPSSAVSAWQAVMRATHLNARRPRR